MRARATRALIDDLRCKVDQIAATIASFQKISPAAPAPPAHNSDTTKAMLAGVAEQLYRERRRREKFFPTGVIFGEPDFDILIDLYVAHARGSTVSVSSACIAASVAPTTALRRITTLVDAGRIERVADPTDRRRTFLCLAEKTVVAMEDYLRTIYR